MPKDEPEPEDPMELVRVLLPVEDDSCLMEMGRCFAEEFARQGWNRRQLLSMFQNSFYIGPHLAWRELGPRTVEAIIDQALRAWQPAGHPGVPQIETSARKKRITLPVVKKEN